MVDKSKNKLMRLASALSVLTAFLLAIFKGIAFFLTGSVAILSGLFDSIQDMLTSLVNLIAVREATMPADKVHRFGHGKAQALGGLIQGLIIIGASLILLKESLLRFIAPQPIHEINIGIGITIFSIIVTCLLVAFQKHVVKKTNSLSIKADLAHYTGDVIMNAGIGISILLSYVFQWYFIDGLFGVIVSVYLITSIVFVLRDSFHMLMDAEISPQVRKQIKKTTCSISGVYDCFDLKTRMSGNEMMAQFSISLDDELSLVQAHDKIDEIERAVRQRFPNMHLIIHPEPISQNKRQRKK